MLTSARTRARLLALLFTASGTTALLAEQIFEKLLSTVVGASTPAATLVLATYFFGLALGGTLYARALAHRVARPVRGYGLLEAAVGGWILLMALAGEHLVELSSRLVHLGGADPGAIFLLRLLVAGLWIVPPTAAMGATFPLMVGALDQLGLAHRQDLVPRFYAFNLLGATLGALAGPYLVFPGLGLRGTLFALVGLQSLVCLGALAADRGLAPRPWEITESEPTEATPAATRDTALPTALSANALPWIAFGSGFLFFGFEVLWTHLAGSVVGTSVYAFGNMLAAVLVALCLAGILASWRRRHHPGTVPGPESLPPQTLGLALAAAAVAVWATLPGWSAAPVVFLRWGATIDSFAAGEALRFAVILALVAPPAASLGTIYPLLFRLRVALGRRPDALAGRLAAANAVGSIGGALVTGFVLLPALGSEGTYRLFGTLLLLAGISIALFLLLRGTRTMRRPALLLLSICLVLGLLAPRIPSWDPMHLTSGANVYFRPLHVTPDSRLVFWHEDLYGGFTTVIERTVIEESSTDPGTSPADSGSESPPQGTATQVRILLTNGKFQGNDGGEMVAQIGFALAPLLYQPNRDRALVIGLGTGQTADVLAKAGFARLEVAEISPGIVHAARQGFPHLNGELWQHPGFRLALEDGRNHLLRSDGGYDLVSVELTSVWFAGASSLYSRELYELVERRLAPGGVFQQWIQLHHIAPREVLSMLVTLHEVFPHVELWYLGHQAIAVASSEPLERSPEALDALTRGQSLDQTWLLLRLLDGSTPETLGRRLLLSQQEIHTLVEEAKRQGVPLNTDGNRFLEYATPRHNLEHRPHLQESLEALLAQLPEAERRARLARALER